MPEDPNVFEALLIFIQAFINDIWVTGGSTALGGSGVLGYLIYARKKKEKNGNGQAKPSGNGKNKVPIVPESQCRVNRREIYDELKKVRESHALDQGQILTAIGKVEGTMKQLTENVNSLINKGLQ